MQFRSSFLALAAILATAVAVAQSSDPLSILKSLPSDQTDSLIQSVLGGKTGDGTKTDQKLREPQTVLQRRDLLQQSEEERRKTRDGHILRVPDEDPELRADDEVLIDLTPIDTECRQNLQNSANQQNQAPPGYGTPTREVNCLGTENETAAPTSDYSNLGALVNSPALHGTDSASGGANRNNVPDISDFGRFQLETKPRTEEDKERSEKYRERILKGNPYRLNHFGVLEIPGLPSIPLAGLTSREASKRLMADTDLRDYVVKLTLLRLAPLGNEALKPFGYDLFQGVPTTFAPVTDIQVPLDYPVGPGDVMNVQMYGNDNSRYALTVDRDGRVNLPKIGPISVAGMTFEAARATLERQIGRQTMGTRVSVTMGDLRSIRVFVLGEAEKPGSYTVGGLSSMTNALFVSGGVKKIGSLRNIQLKRNGRLVTVLDLYDLLLHGDSSGDRQLMPGDVIFIPPIGDTVSVYGAVRRPAIYELKGEKTPEQIVEMAGGLMPDADSKTVQVERIEPSRLREMRNVDLMTAEGRAIGVRDGDKLRVPTIRPTLENSVELTGYVFRPGSFQWHDGLHLSDVLGSFDELQPNADRHYIMIRREVPPQEKVEVLSADLVRALAAPGGAADPALKPRDKIFVFDLSSRRDRILEPIIKDLELQGTPDKPAQIVSIDGRVDAPGRYPLEPAMHVSDLIRAGGSLEDSSFSGEAELTRYEVLNGNARETQLIPVNLAAIRRGDANADVELRPYDRLIIKITPQWTEPGTIELKGEVRFPGKYPIHRGETLTSVIRRAGGFTDLAFTGGTVFTREELRKREKEQIELLINRLQSDLAALSLEAIASSASNANANGAAGAGQGLLVGQQLLQQLRDTKPVGRLVIDIDRVMKGRPGATGDVLLRDGDMLLIPKKTQEITILGEVQSPTSHVYEAGLTRDEYIAKSGGTTAKADRKRIYVVRANGDVVSGERSGWFRRSHSVEMQPGDTIVVPLDTERIRALPLWQAVTTIIYNLAVALLAVRNV
jgi:protein involved in polysaccharide export with SLBB domain